ASHELRTPLTTITANVQMAERTLSVLSQSMRAIATNAAPNRRSARLEQLRALLERTNRQVGRLDRLVGDLLDVSRIQAGKLNLRLEECDLVEIVGNAVQEQRAAWPQRRIALRAPRRANLRFVADADRIGQVITNYLTNALKYSAPEQPVTVSARAVHGQARVEVRDAGPGLAPEQQVHLFEQFYRVPGIERQSGSGVGLGLGLHICKTIVERHGGAVGVESAPGAGSTFWFTLPLEPALPDRVGTPAD
ncbi:MAG TPA: HAMP domain-containing sensor histidine kinase, partial [Ktedonobacterales bacterium]|nr:HAMP domain-containing sensor histidine kinase [Ktedonobacterales bacterium]